MKFKALTGLVLAAVMSLSGCSAVSTAVKKRNLDVKTQLSETIWLDPVGPEQRTVYLQVRNTTDKQFSIEPQLTERLNQKGYTVTTDPSAAHYWIQANVLKLEKMDLRDAHGLFSGGYGSALAGGGIAALALSTQTSRSSSLVGAGLLGAAVGFAADALVEDVNYTMITDVRVVEATDAEVTTTDTAALSNGNSSTKSTKSVTTENKQRFQTRVMSNANKVNLEFEEAQPALIDGLATSISGIF